ncbi:galactose oxidase [Prosthecobacter sp.]|uniref:galactose oxidase n=1 Tax=Prosthecobacter sp. TaxID=1965333 RepID=UPI003783D09A
MLRPLLCLMSLTFTASAADSSWSQLPSLPDARGFAGSFAGVVDGTLMVAGGTHFRDKMPWEGGTKLWYDTLFALEKPDGAWRVAGKLPKPNGYGVSLTTPQGWIILGGGNATEHFQEVFWVQKNAPLPPLPKPCAFMCGCESEGVIYIAGGIETPTATGAMNIFWSLDLNKSGAQWQELPPCPGRPRILGCMAAAGGVVHLFSGAALHADKDGKPEREWLSDAWAYEAAKGWRKLPDMPRVAVAAPNPAPVVDSKIYIIGGDDGANVNFMPKEKHPGFPQSILVYDVKTQAWSQAGEVPFSLVTTNAVLWKGQIVIPGGEARPGVRSPQVWSGELK